MEKRKAAVTDDAQEENHNAEVHSQIKRGPGQVQNTRASKTQQPNASNADVSHSNRILFSQSSVEDGVNDCNVALHTGHEVKQSLSEWRDRQDGEPSQHYILDISVATTEEQGEPQEFLQLHCDGVIEEEVRMTRLCPRGPAERSTALLVTQEENEEEEREEEDVDDEDTWEDKDAVIGPETRGAEEEDGGVRWDLSNVGKGGGVERHVYICVGRKKDRTGERC